MKTVTIKEMKRLAEYYGGTFTNDLLPAIEFNDYGIEATQIDGDECYGFKFYGHASNQEKVIDLWNELTEDQVTEKVLTIELAKSLIGEKLLLAYRGSSGHEHEMNIDLKNVIEKNERSIGQSTTHYLQFIEDSYEKDYIYEWQGIFRVTGSAHKVYLKKIIE